MARIRLMRKRSRWKDALRKYRVLLDGNVVAKIKNGEERVFDVEAGTHEVYLKVDWGKSPILELDLAPGEQATLVADAGQVFPGAFRAFFRPASYIELERVS